MVLRGGGRFSWRDEYETAASLLKHVVELKSDHTPTYWYWMEALRSRSNLQTPPYVDERFVEESLAVWEKGVKVSLPDADYSWAYVGRALLCEQQAHLPDADRWALWWEAIVYLERAILLGEYDAYRWAYLGRYHRYLQTESTALHATGKSLEYESENLAALEERAAILANVGRFDEAEEVVNKRRALEPRRRESLHSHPRRAYARCA